MSSTYLSIICSLDSSESDVLRMLNSIISQSIHPDDYEIIAVNDPKNSALDLEVLHQFIRDHHDIHISILCVDNDIHTKANIYRIGLNEANGLWFTFIHGTDSFAHEGCLNFLKYIDAFQGNKLMVKSQILQVSENQQPLQVAPINTAYLQGNFYNRQFLLDHNISFDTRMQEFEDLYFNSSYFANVFYFGDPNEDFGYMDQITYNWTISDNLLSSDKFNSNEHIELKNIRNWIQGSFAPFEKYLHIWPVPNTELFKNRIRQITFSLYHYYENALFRSSIDDISSHFLISAKEEIKKYFADLIPICTNAFKSSILEIMNESPDIFCEEYASITETNDYFVPIHSFKEFVTLILESLYYHS